MRALSVALIALALSGLSGCYTTRMVYAESAGRAGANYETWSHALFWGIVPLGTVNLDGYCGDAGIRRVKTQIGGIGLVANFLTVGIWTPMHVHIVCNAPKQ